MPRRQKTQLQIEPTAAADTRDETFTAGPETSQIEAEIEGILNRIPWKNGQATATKTAQALGTSNGRLLRAILDGTALRTGTGSRGRVKLAGIRLMGEWWISREALGEYMRLLNGLDAPPGPSTTSPPGRRSVAERRRAIAEANAVAESLGS